MLRYKDYKLIKPNENIEKQIDLLIQRKDGSVFHEVGLNRIIEKNFNTDLYYLVENPTNIQHAAPVHITRNKYGLKQYSIRPLYDMPYAGFIGEGEIDISNLKIDLFESVHYGGFPYIMKNDDLTGTNYGETAMLDLTWEEDDIFYNVINYRRRRKIKKAINSGINVKAFFNIKGLNIFWPILHGLHKKLNYTRLTFDYYEKLFQKF